MNNKLKILLATILLTTLLTREKVCEHLGFGQAKSQGNPIAVREEVEQPEKQEMGTDNYFIDDSLYCWDEQMLDWMPVKDSPEYQAQLVTSNMTAHPTAEPIEVAWEVLMDIRYRLRYFSELEMAIYAPVFPRAIEALDGKEVIIEGFVIPFDVEEELLSLSANPYASCFFCGKASPASVISMYLKNKRKHYKMDEFKRYRGTLHLNHDDPNEFYYILRNAEEE